MAWQYKLTPLALSDIDEALSYIGGNLSNPTAAGGLYSALVKEIGKVCAFPYAYPDCAYYLIDDENIRHTVVGNYMLIYEISSDEELIKFLRFLYAGRDIAHTDIILLR